MKGVQEKGGWAGKKEKGREKDQPFSLQLPLDFFAFALS